MPAAHLGRNGLLQANIEAPHLAESAWEAVELHRGGRIGGGGGGDGMRLKLAL